MNSARSEVGVKCIVGSHSQVPEKKTSASGIGVDIQGGPKTAHGFHCSNSVYSQPIFIIFGRYKA